MEIKADLHIHTNKSEDGVHSLRNIISAAKSCGLDAIAIADHNVSYVRDFNDNGQILIIPACEVSTTDGHILGLFLDAPLDMLKLTENGLPTGRMAAEEIRLKGGIVIAAHPFHRVERFAQKPDLYEYVDGIEGANARAYFKNPKANEEALTYAKEHNLFTTGSSDAHSKYEVGNAYTVIDCEKLNVESLKKAVAGGTCYGVMIKNTPRWRKGISQLYKSCRTKKITRICRSIGYLGYCILEDITKK